MANVSGSFFNPVPENNDNNDDNDNATKNKDGEGNDDQEAEDKGKDAFEMNLAEVLRKRNQVPLASQPSTIEGVPTSKAKGEDIHDT
jgi:hypothetical protein